MTHTAQLNSSGNVSACNQLATAFDQAEATPPQSSFYIIQICMRWQCNT
jgi:hypothetical protein